ncbi:anion exchanging protein [Sistotremastrum suecicum HHB10207 ss-3]|uniref:Anion exchanging protein n=1 Tax=Sistotremastrum suecicum HHB10207 ss-3 TaxID=1314776 RepID=A0A166ARZ0_9AGAM|nr:anion exchanging protein [Sistotremastrum suecicum HHB10207 ss-3]
MESLVPSPSRTLAPTPEPGVLPVTNDAALNRTFEEKRDRDEGQASSTEAFATKAKRGIIRDLRARAPFYVSDWTDAWNYRVVPATAFTFCTNVLPGIAFSLDLIETTSKYGVEEVLLASFIPAFIFSLFGAQPLVIAGVTGPITVFNKTIFDILQSQTDPPDYLQFIGWVYLWGAILHFIAAIFNWCNLLRYVTRFPCDTFGFFVSWVYLQYGIQILTRELHSNSQASAFLSIILALLMTSLSFLFLLLSRTKLFNTATRRFLADYGMPISILAASGVSYWGSFNAANASTLPVGGAFTAAGGRSWIVRFWELDGKWVGIAFPFGFILFVLFYFDHNVSSLMAQGSEFPLRKPPGFHWDFMLLGITTFLAGLLGTPAPNGLIPQAPIHTHSLRVMSTSRPKDEGDSGDERGLEGGVEEKQEMKAERRDEFPIGVVEQRVSNLAQGSLCLVLLTGPFLHVLNLIPRGVLAGLFWYMGIDALLGSGVTSKIFYLLREKRLTSAKDPFRRVRRWRIVLFLLLQLVGFGATFAIVQTIASIGFPIVIALLIPLRIFIVPLLPFTDEELAILDGPTASPFTMESVGGVRSGR